MSTEINHYVTAPNQFRCDYVVMLVVKDFSKSLKRYNPAVLQFDPFINAELSPIGCIVCNHPGPLDSFYTHLELRPMSTTLAARVRDG